jgi:tetratricopeptide (TPR) repeat protein
MPNYLKLLVILIILPLVQASTFQIDPAKNAIWHNQRGLFFLRFGNYLGAIQEFNIAIALNHETEVTGVFYNNLGRTYRKLGVNQNALECFQKAISYDPNFLEFHLNMIDTYEQMGKLNSLIKGYENILAKNRYDSRAYLELGLIHRKLGNNDRAVGYLREFKRLEPDLDITKQIDAIIRELR